MEPSNIYRYKQFNKNIKDSKVIRIGKLLFILRHRPIDSETGEVIYDDFIKALKICMENVRSDVECEGIKIEDITRITVYLKNQDNLNALDEFFFTFFNGKLPVKKVVEATTEVNFPVQIDVMAIAR